MMMLGFMEREERGYEIDDCTSFEVVFGWYLGKQASKGSSSWRVYDIDPK